MGEKKHTDNQMSLSKERKLARKKEIAHMKRNKAISKVVGICVVVLLVAGIGSLIGYKIYRNATKIVPSSNFSQGIKDNGFIDGVTATDYIELCDYNNITVTSEDVSYTEEELAADIKAAVNEKATLDANTDAAIADGDKVNIDFVGTMDGQEFDGGNSNGEGYDLTIGSNEMIEGFEDQLIGHKVGDNFTINVTFPEDYDDEALAGKPANFEITVNGIYIAPAFDDAFVKENLSDKASTAEEYKEYLKTTKYNAKLETWLSNYLETNSKVTNYPEGYLKDLMEVQKYADYSMYEFYNQFYEQNYGMAAYTSFENYVGTSEAKYDKELVEDVKPKALKALVYQAILEKEGVTITEDDYIAYLESNGQTKESYDSEVEQSGKGFVLQKMVKIKALEIVKEKLK